MTILACLIGAGLVLSAQWAIDDSIRMVDALIAENKQLRKRVAELEAERELVG